MTTVLKKSTSIARKRRNSAAECCGRIGIEQLEARQLLTTTPGLPCMEAMKNHTHRFILLICIFAAVDLHSAEFHMPEELESVSWPIISADGQTVVFGDSFDGKLGLLSWNVNDGVAETIDLRGQVPEDVSRIRPRDIAADGTITGYLNLPSDRLRDGQAFRWSETAGIQLLDLQGQYEDTRGYGVSADGSVIVGWGKKTNLTSLVWNGSSASTELGGLDGFENSLALDISDDGNVIVGESFTQDSLGRRSAVGWVWTALDGFVATDSPLGINQTSAFLVSGDGSVVVGQGADGSFRWTKEDGYELLGSSAEFLEDRGPWAISQDGSVILGRYRDRAYVWDEENKMRDLEAVLRGEHGLNVPNNDRFHVGGISDNLQTLVGLIKTTTQDGQSEDRLWIASLDQPLVGVPEPSAFALAGFAVLFLANTRKPRTSLPPSSEQLANRQARRIARSPGTQTFLR